MPSFAIIIPCYNEAKRLRTEAFVEFIATHADVNIYFVNDGSQDETKNVLMHLQKHSDSFRTINLDQNKGKGEAIREGMLQLYKSFNYIGYLDADLSTSLDEFYTLYQKILSENAAVVFGSRIQKADTIIKRSYARHMIGRMIATMIDGKFKLGYYDTQCGAKIFSATVLKDIIQQPFYTRWFFDVEIFVRIKKQYGDVKILEIPLAIWRNVKDSKLSALSFPVITKEIYLLLTKY